MKCFCWPQEFLKVPFFLVSVSRWMCCPQLKVMHLAATTTTIIQKFPVLVQVNEAYISPVVALVVLQYYSAL